MIQKDNSLILEEEAEYFDKLAANRSKYNIVPLTADIQNSTFYEPVCEKDYDKSVHPHNELNDVKMTAIFSGVHRSATIQALANCPRGDVLDVCCGPGWLSLELARQGRNLKSFDISAEAIKVAKQHLEINKTSEGFGSIEYFNKNILDQDLSEFNISGVAGWSGFHHLPDPKPFLLKLYDQLPQGGIVVTFDDLGSGPLERYLRYFFKFILPVYEYTFLDKLKFIFSVVFKRRKLNQMLESPMEIESDKHGKAAEDIREVLVNTFTPIYDKEFAAFSVFVCLSIKGPNWFRYAAAKMVNALDNMLVQLGICKGSYRIIIAKK